MKTDDPIEDWQSLLPWLDELFDLPEAAREQRLTSLFVSDPALARQLRAVLRADAASGVLDLCMGDLAPTVVSRLADAESSGRVSPRWAGQMLGRYRLVEPLGRGGMGEVWLGERVGDFEQRVAVKLIRPLIDSEALRKRFAREQRLLARLQHPNIVQLLDGGVTEDDIPWYAMALVTGENIVEYCDRRRLGTRDRVGLLLQACDAVAFAQTQLVVHRDLKPSNVLVDEQRRVRVLDFGIARLIGDTADVRLTETGIRLYSPAYAAPEQIRGEDVGTAVDVFALGAMLFELLVGEPPFPHRTANPERLLATLEQERAPVPSVAKRRNRPAGLRQQQVDQDLDLVVANALHPDPSRRYPNAAAFADDLRRWLDDRPVAAHADTTGYRMRRFVARHRLVVGSAAAIVIALLSGLALAIWQARVADAQARRADAEAQRVERTYRFVLSLLQNNSPVRGGGDSPQRTVEMLLRDGLARIDEELADLPDIRGGLRAALAEPLWSLGHHQEALPQLLRATDELERFAPDAVDEFADALLNLAMAEREAGDLGAARGHAERALALFDGDSREHRLGRIQARGLLANLLTQQGGDESAIEMHKLILSDRRSLPDYRPIDSAADMNNLAAAYLAVDHFVDAEREYRALDALLRASPDAPPSRRVFALAGIAWSLFGRGQHDAAIEVASEMDALGRQSLSSSHPVVMNGLVLRARIAAARREDAATDALFARAVAGLPAGSSASAELHWGLDLLRRGQVELAASHLEHARDRLAGAQGPASATTLLADAALRVLSVRQGQSGLALLPAAIEAFDHAGRVSSDEFVRACLLVSDAGAALGDARLSSLYRQRAHEVARRLLGDGHPLTREASMPAEAPASEGEHRHDGQRPG